LNYSLRALHGALCWWQAFGALRSFSLIKDLTTNGQSAGRPEGKALTAQCVGLCVASCSLQPTAAVAESLAEVPLLLGALLPVRSALCRNKGFAFCDYVDPQRTPDCRRRSPTPGGCNKPLGLQRPPSAAVFSLFLRVCTCACVYVCCACVSVCVRGCVGGCRGCVWVCFAWGGSGLQRSDGACGDWPRQPARRTRQESARHARTRRSARRPRPVPNPLLACVRAC
jgi:hypothetical protein